MVRTEDGALWPRVPAHELTPLVDVRGAWACRSLDEWADMRHTLRARMLRHAYQSGELSALSHSRLMLLPHQVFVAHRVVSEPEPRFLLADEPGLGKTIEAGLVAKELLAREQARRILIVTPASLTTQWQQEMRIKFGEHFDLFDGSMLDVLARDPQGGNPWLLRDRVITSLQFVRREPRASMAVEAGWDLVIFDEAHHLRASASESYRLAERLSASTTSVLMLTATPMQLSRDEFYQLLTLLAPGRFRDPADLEERLRARTANLRAMALLRRYQRLPEAARAEVCEALGLASCMVDDAREYIKAWPTQGYDLLGRVIARSEGCSRGLDRIGVHLNEVEDLGQALAELGATWADGRAPGESAERWEALLTLLAHPERYRALEDRLTSTDPLSAVMIRNRRQRVFGSSHPGRRVLLAHVDLTAEERCLYDAVTAYVQEGYALAQRTKNTPLQLIMVLMHRLLTSSIAALSHSLRKRRERLEAGLASALAARLDEEGDGEAEGVDIDATIEDAEAFLEESTFVHAATTQEIDHLNRLIALADRVAVDSKARRLVTEITALKSTRSGEAPPKVLVFTQFLRTQDYLRSLLEKSGLRVVCFNGTMSPQEKDAAISAFRREGDVLISTEAGGEGRNLQFCHIMVNYDLPWNPMRVEQRIGRLDRIGQRHRVIVQNLAIQGTIEGRILTALHERVHLFEETIGALDPVLGERTERSIADIVMTPASEEAVSQRIDQLASELADQRAAADRADAMMDDFIMDANSCVVESANAILAAQGDGQAGVRLGEFVRGFLSRYPTAKVEESRPGVFTIETPPAFLDDCQRSLRLESIPRFVTGTFDRETALEDEALPMLTFGNGLVDAIMDYCTRCDEHGRFGGKASAVRVTAGALPPGKGFLFLFEMQLEGITQRRHLEPIYVPVCGPEIDAAKMLEMLLWVGSSVEGLSVGADDEVVAQAEAALKDAEVLVEECYCRELAAFSAETKRQAQKLRHRLELKTALLKANAERDIEQVEEQIARFTTYPQDVRQQILPAWQGQLRAAKRRLQETLDKAQRDLDDLRLRSDAAVSVPEAVACVYVEVAL
ncbi:MAG: DEAD/DEAH box helicase [Thermacetogeniaceae bacterium]